MTVRRDPFDGSLRRRLIVTTHAEQTYFVVSHVADVATAITAQIAN